MPLPSRGLPAFPAPFASGVNMYGIKGPQPGTHPLHDTADVPSGAWIPCTSSNIVRFRYWHAQHAIDVEFHSGKIARYFDEPWSKYAAFVGATSKGKWHRANLWPSTNWTYI
jgi:hypothetical protein